MRICHLAYTFYENDNRVLRYAETLVADGAEVDVIALRRPNQERSSTLRGVRVSRIQRRVKTEKRAATYLLKLLWFFIQSTVVLSVRQLWNPYDVVHVHNVPDFLVLAAIVPKLTGARVILDIHDILPELYSAKFNASRTSTLFSLLLMIERTSCRFADHVIVANHLWRDRLVARTVAPEKCSAILNYPDLTLFKPNASRRRDADRAFIFLYPGTLNHHQGLDVAVEAFAKAEGRMPNAELHIYGEGPARSSLATLVSRHKLEHRIKLMDALPIHRIADVMASADVGVEPKRAEGFGGEALSTKILEFMACGVPVIASRTSIHARYFDDTVLKFFTSGDADELAGAFVAFYQGGGDPDKINAARAFALRFSWQSHRSDYQSLVQRAHVRALARETSATADN